MEIKMQMPKMGESLQEGTITKWLKKPGDKIDRDEMILEISTDKVDTEIPSPKAGVLKEILAEEGDTVEVGSDIAVIETEGGDGKKEETKVEKETEEKKEEKTEKEEKDESKKLAEEEDDEDEDEEPELETKESSEGIIDIQMPKMGESLQEGTITKWLKKEGDKIERDEMIFEISTDKVDTEVPSPVAGVLSEILAQEGDTVEVGETVARISKEGAAPAKKGAPKKEKRESAEEKEDKKEKKTAAKEAGKAPEISEDKGSEIPRKSGGRFYSPLVRSIAEAEGVTVEELEKIEGSGADGRVTKKDLLEYLDERSRGKAVVRQEPRAISKRPEEKPAERKQEIQVGPDDEVIPMDRIRRLISEHMIYSKRTSAHVTSVAEADVTGILQFRNAHKDSFQKEKGFKLTFTPFFTQAIVEGVKEFPRVNVSTDGNNIILHKRINVGVATALEDGNLIVPVVKDADDLSLTGLARAIDDLAKRARNKKLHPDEIQGGTISMTNVGTFGTLFGTPIINQPQSAIIGVGAIKRRPVVKQYEGSDVIVIRDMMYVSITYDHRVIDGMLAGKTLAKIVDTMENMNEKTLNL